MPTTEEITLPVTPQRADVRTPEKASEPATDIEVVPDTPPAVIRPGRGRGRGKYRAQQQQAPQVGMRSSSRIQELEQREVGGSTDSFRQMASSTECDFTYRDNDKENAH